MANRQRRVLNLPLRILSGLLLLAAWCLFIIQPVSLEAAAMGYVLVDDLAKTPILTPSLAGREIKKIRLDNELEAYLISDPTAKQSGAGLSVMAGSWDDPEDSGGMAHFCEHMLFLGTKKYPGEEEYQTYINGHCGQVNAYTASDHTTFMFSVANEAFAGSDGALDRFAQFFISPLFNESAVEREMNAVDSEYAKDCQIDAYRTYYVQRSLGNSAHPQARFDIGRMSTLQKIKREKLQEWYAAHYSANLMHLVVYSKLPMSELLPLVVSDFQGVKNNGAKPAVVDVPILSSKQMGHILYVKPLKQLRTVTLTWEVPVDLIDIKTQPDRIVGYILGDEREGSLLDQLKAEGLAEKLGAGSSKLGSHSMLFDLQVGLTEEGIKKIDTVILRCFEAIAFYRSNEIPPYMFKEMHDMAKLHYQYQSRDEVFKMVSSYAEGVVREDLTTFPERLTTPESFDAMQVNKFLQGLAPEKCMITVVVDPKETGVETSETEQWLCGEYAVQAVLEGTLKEWQEAKPSTFVRNPSPNSLIPENLTLLQKTIEPNLYPQPILIADEERARVFFARDTNYLVPEVAWVFNIKTPAIRPGDPRSMVLTELYLRALSEKLSTFSYMAQMAGLESSLGISEGGVRLSIRGYSEKASALLEEVLKSFKSISLTREEFKIYHQSLLMSYTSAKNEEPVQQAIERLQSVIHKRFVTAKAKARVMADVTLDSLEKFAHRLFVTSYIEGILYGNMEEAQARAVVGKVLTALPGHPYPISKQFKDKVIVLPKEGGPFEFVEEIKIPQTSAILVIQSEPYSLKNRALQQVLGQGLQSDFYDTLRTKQQTGYIVQSWEQEMERQLFYFFAVQSNSQDARSLLMRYEFFFENYLQDIEKKAFPKERFEQIQKTLVVELGQLPNTLQDMADRLFSFAFKYDGDFDWMKKRLEAMKEMTYEEFIAGVKDVLGRENKRRFAVLLQGALPQASLSYHPLKSVEELRKVSHYLAKPPGVQ